MDKSQSQARFRRPWAQIWSPFPARVRPGSGRFVPFLATVGLLILLWWAVTAAGVLPARVLPGPGAVFARLIGQAQSGVVEQYVWPTVLAAFLGAALAVVVGVPLGIVIAHSRTIAAVMEPFVAISQTVPLVAVAPLLVIWIGYGTLPIAVLCAIVAFFPIVTTTVIGLRGLDMRVVEAALLDDAGFFSRLFEVEGPMAAPAILAGIRAGVVLAMTGAVVGELVIGGSGLGTLLTQARQAADTAAVFAVIIWISLVALAFDGVIQLAERAAVNRLQGETT